MGIIILLALVVALAVSLVVAGIAAFALTRVKLEYSQYLLIVGVSAIALLVWLAYFNFLNWYNAIEALEPSSQAGAVVPFVFALGLAPGVSAFAVFAAAVLVRIYRWASTKKK